MDQDQVFSIVLSVVFLITLPIGIFHRLKSQRTREKLDRRQEGLFILATLRPLGLVVWLSAIAWAIDPAYLSWASVPLPVGMRWAGVCLLVVGCGLLLWTFRSLGNNLTDTVVTREAHTLVLHGPYRWIRHPLYSSAALFIVALALTMANWFILVTGVAVVGLLIVRTRIEEENLVARFGERYRDYMARTGRFFPRIGPN